MRIYLVKLRKFELKMTKSMTRELRFAFDQKGEKIQIGKIKCV